MQNLANDQWIKSTCPYCGVGCGIEAKVDDVQVLEIRGDKDHPANKGKLCSKGLALADTLVPEGRLNTPVVRGQQTDWSTATAFVATEFNRIIEQFGRDSVAFYVSGQLLTEDYYVANKLMKGFIGSGNIDTNSRLCMSSTVAGHKKAFGSDTVPGCYEDLELADLVVLTGSNLAWCHPVLFQRIKAEKQRRPAMQVIVIDPRRTDSCDIADQHLAIQPGSDVILFNGLLQYLVDNGALNKTFIDQHCNGFDSVLQSLQDDTLTMQRISAETGLTAEALNQFYRAFTATDKTVTVFSQGVNQSSQGTDKVNSIINCHLATGRVGKPGSSPFSITGQPNAMGGREVGGLANTLAAHLEFEVPEHHQLLSEFWQTDKLASKPGYKAVEMFDRIERGEIKAVWIMATNPLVSLPNRDKIKSALQKCDLVVVSDCIAATDSNEYADVLLPAQGWGEKSGTVTNSERCISRQRSLLKPTNMARPDWQIICDVGRQMGFDEAFNYSHPAEIFAEHAKLTAYNNNGVRDLNLEGYSQLSAEQYQHLAPAQWPVLKPGDSQQRCFGDGQFYTPDGKARFVVTRQNKTQPKPEGYPLLLNTGRIRDQWHTMTRTGLSTKLSAHRSEPFVEIHPEDGKQLQLNNRQLANIRSEFGTITVRVLFRADQQRGQVFCPMHWNQQFSSNGAVNTLVKAMLDPYSGQPEFKMTAVAISPAEFASEAYLLTTSAIEMAGFDYWSRQKVDRGYLYRIASKQNAEQLEQQLKLHCHGGESSRQICFSQPQTGRYRWANIMANNIASCYVVAASLYQEDYSWLEILLNFTVDRDVEISLLTGKPAEVLSQGKIICACKQVGENTLSKAITEQQISSCEQLSQCTGAGTGCGSCLPELKQMLAEVGEGAAETTPA